MYARLLYTYTKHFFMIEKKDLEISVVIFVLGSLKVKKGLLPNFKCLFIHMHRYCRKELLTRTEDKMVNIGSEADG